MSQYVGILAQLDQPALDEVILRVAKLVGCAGSGPIFQNAGAGNEIALPVAFDITGIPGVWQLRPDYWTLYRRRTRSASSAAVIEPRA